MAHVKNLMKILINTENMSKFFSNQLRAAGIERKKMTGIYLAVLLYGDVSKLELWCLD